MAMNDEANFPDDPLMDPFIRGEHDVRAGRANRANEYTDSALRREYQAGWDAETRIRGAQ